MQTWLLDQMEQQLSEAMKNTCKGPVMKAELTAAQQ